MTTGELTLGFSVRILADIIFFEINEFIVNYFYSTDIAAVRMKKKKQE